MIEGKNPVRTFEEMMDNAKHCHGCDYYCARTMTCDHILYTGKPRPCGLGKNCTIKKCGPKRRYHRFDGARAMELYRRGYNDTQISKAMDVWPATVGSWRKREGLPTNQKISDDTIRLVYDTGATDKEISIATGISLSYAGKWRRKHGLKANKRKGKEHEKD